MEALEQALRAVVKMGEIRKDEPMRKHTTFRIGGPADYLVRPKTPQETAEVLAVCRSRQVPFYIMGNGSNLLVGDGGYRGVIVQLFRNQDQMQVKGEEIKAQAGVLLASLSAKALEHNLTGFEYASGIPGTIGGAVVMNAGAYGSELKDVLVEAEVLTPAGEIKTVSGKELAFGYRTSIVSAAGYVVLGATIRLQRGEGEQIQAKLEAFRKKRQEKQPLEFPSAGSTFRRPEGYFAGKLIEDAGLRGFRVGDAMVSEKHCGFIVNERQATALQVRKLIEQVQKKVKEQTGVWLELEIRQIGEF